VELPGIGPFRATRRETQLARISLAYRLVHLRSIPRPNRSRNLRYVERIAPESAPEPATAADWADALYRPLHPRPLPKPESGTVPITLIPYYAWANRGPSLMEVWIPLAR